jgi:hypothetical protein
MAHRHCWWTIGLAVAVVVLIAATLTACGTDDPYSGTWTGDKGSGTVTIKIEKANTGWWKIDIAPEAIQTYGAEIEGGLQTMNGGVTFKRSGDHLEETDAAHPGAEPAVLTRQ